MPGGRPTKLTEETKATLLQGIQAGLPYELSCNAAGVSYRAFRNWVLKGEKAQSGEYFQLVQDLKIAEGQGATRLIGLIQRSANEGQWQAGAWILERRYPQYYSRNPHPEEAKKPQKPTLSEDMDPKKAYLAELRWVREQATQAQDLALVLRTLEHEAEIMGLTADSGEIERMADSFMAGVHTVKQMAAEDLSE